MPVYVYKCSGCGIVSDVFLGVFDDSEVVCQSCGEVMGRVPSFGAVHFRGGDWGHQ